MVTCNDCIHRCVCPIADGCEYADEQHIHDDCEYFAPTADVVPKSEVDTLNKQLDELAEEHSDLIVEKDQLFDEVVRLQAEVDRLQKHNTNVAFKHYDDGRKDVAREIFEEIEKILPTNMTVNGTFYRIYLKDAIAELKKKYTEEKQNG